MLVVRTIHHKRLIENGNGVKQGFGIHIIFLFTRNIFVLLFFKISICTVNKFFLSIMFYWEIFP